MYYLWSKYLLVDSLCDDVNIVENGARYESKKVLMNNLKNNQGSLLTKLEKNLDIQNLESFLEKLKPSAIVTEVAYKKVSQVNIEKLLE